MFKIVMMMIHLYTVRSTVCCGFVFQNLMIEADKFLTENTENADYNQVSI